jgi:hypothetical protein
VVQLNTAKAAIDDVKNRVSAMKDDLDSVADKLRVLNGEAAGHLDGAVIELEGLLCGCRDAGRVVDVSVTEARRSLTSVRSDALRRVQRWVRERPRVEVDAGLVFTALDQCGGNIDRDLASAERWLAANFPWLCGCSTPERDVLDTLPGQGNLVRRASR